MSKASKPPGGGKTSGTRRFRQKARRPGYWAEAKRRQREQANEEYGKAAVTRWRKLEKRAHRAATQVPVLIPASGDTFRVLRRDYRPSRIALTPEDAFIAGFGMTSFHYSLDLHYPHVGAALDRLVARATFDTLDDEALGKEAWTIAALLRVEAGRAFHHFRHPVTPVPSDELLYALASEHPRGYLATVSLIALLVPWKQNSWQNTLAYDLYAPWRISGVPRSHWWCRTRNAASYSA